MKTMRRKKRMTWNEIFNVIKENLEDNGINVSDEEIDELVEKFFEEVESDTDIEEQLKYFTISIIDEFEEE